MKIRSQLALLVVAVVVPVALLAGATTMKLRYFAPVVLVGRITRFLLVAYGVAILPFW